MFYKILDGGIYTTNIFDKNRFTFTICDIKTFHDLTIKFIKWDSPRFSGSFQRLSGILFSSLVCVPPTCG